MPRTLAGARNTAGNRTTVNRNVISGLTFNGSSSYVSLGTLGTLGSSLGSGLYFSIDFSTTTTTQDMLFGTFNTGTTMALSCQLNTNSAGSSASNSIRIFCRDNSGNQIQCATATSACYADGRRHTLSVFARANQVSIWLDGAALGTTYNVQNTLSSFANFAFALTLGCNNSRGTLGNFFNGTVYSFKIGLSDANLYGNWQLTDGSGTTATDSSGKGNTGTLSGASLPTWVSTVLLPTIDSARFGTASSPVPIIIDTDCCSDIDDFGAITCAFHQQLLGNCLVLGVNINTSAAHAPGAIDAMRKYLGLPSIPFSSHAAVGTFSPLSENACYAYVYNNFAHDVGLASTLQTPTTNFRTLLAARSQPDVVITAIGYGNDLAALLQSPADGISPLTGLQLVAASCKLLVWTGGIYPSGTDPANFARDLTDAAYVIANWPTPVIFFPGGSAGSSIGGLINAPNTLSSLPAASPCKAAYQQFGVPDSGHASWDSCTTMIAIEGTNAWQLTQGTNSLNTGTGVNTFTPGAGNQYYATNTQQYPYYANHFTDLMRV